VLALARGREDEELGAETLEILDLDSAVEVVRDLTAAEAAGSS
jgi:hypothetical protein